MLCLGSLRSFCPKWVSSLQKRKMFSCICLLFPTLFVRIVFIFSFPLFFLNCLEGSPPTGGIGLYRRKDFYHTGRILFYNSWKETFGKLQMYCSEFHQWLNPSSTPSLVPTLNFHGIVRPMPSGFWWWFYYSRWIQKGESEGEKGFSLFFHLFFIKSFSSAPGAPRKSLGALEKLLIKNKFFQCS